MDPTNASTVANHWYIAADTGGVWETTDAGASWTPKTDGYDIPSLAVSTVTMAPSNPATVFATTRDTSGSVLKSLDGGASWTQQYTFLNTGNFYFAGLEVDLNPKIVLAMIYNGNSQASGGLFKSSDGGETFDQKVEGPGTDLAVNPQNFNQSYAAVRSGGQYENASYNGIYRSLNGSDWTRLTGSSAPWEPILYGWGLRIAIAPSNPDIVYVVVPGSDIPGRTSQLWKTDNAWAANPTWTALPNCVSGAEILMVDPSNPTTLYLGAGGDNALHRFTAGAACENWVPIQAGTHVDHYSIAAAGSTILLGNDGGLWATVDQGATWITKNTNLGTIQFYAGSLHPTRGTEALGGSQDNGTEVWTGHPTWELVWFGDGGYSAFASASSDPDHNWLVSHSSLNIYRVALAAVPPNPTFFSAMTGIESGDHAYDHTLFIPPIRRSPNGDVVLAGSDNIWKSTNFFTAQTPTWSKNSQELGAGILISAIAFAPSDTTSSTYAYGTANGELRQTTTAGGRWKNMDPSPGGVPNGYVSAIAFHPTDPNTIYVALASYPAGTYVFKTMNGLDASPTWVPKGPPATVPIHALAIDPANPNTIFAGADIGVWKSVNGGDSWSPMVDIGMPNVPVLDLLFSPADGLLTAFTYGRGAFKLNAGSLQGIITPLGATMAGAKWNVDGGPFQPTGTIIPGLAPGNHTVTFSPAVGYSAPPNQTITITANQATQTTGVYQLQ